MRAALGIIAAAFVFVSGCAEKDWIDRTLVTVDVTGTWSGMLGASPSGEIQLELEQQGSTVKGVLKLLGGAAGQSGRFQGGPLEGTVAGDVFRFRDTRNGMEGELTVSGDEMNGMMSHFGQRRLSLRRLDPTSPPVS